MTARPPKGKHPQLVLCLYLAGDSPNSALAKTHLRTAIAHLAKEDVTLELVDVLRDPARGLRDGVLVTPTLVRVAPTPEQRVIGNLRDRSALLAGLGISEVGRE
ncbi:MAG TPA: circadian clock KaiB family protein [Polyangiaceae bacterium]|nr:circadian clock KaiB family protein [Polyangiaceae bacterium]